MDAERLRLVCATSDAAILALTPVQTAQLTHIGRPCPFRPGESGEPPGDTLALFRLGGPFQLSQRRAQCHSRRLTQP